MFAMSTLADTDTCCNLRRAQTPYLPPGKRRPPYAPPPRRFVPRRAAVVTPPDTVRDADVRQALNLIYTPRIAFSLAVLPDDLQIW